MTDQAVRQQILAYIIRFKREHDGNSPSYREIKDALEISSTSIVAYHLDQLQLDGLIRRPVEMGGARMIEVVGGEWCPPSPRKRGEPDCHVALRAPRNDRKRR